MTKTKKIDSEQYEKKVYYHKIQNPKYLILAGIFFLIGLGYAGINGPFLSDVGAGIVVGSLSVCILFVVLWICPTEKIDVPYEKCCKTCFYRREELELNMSTHKTSKVLKCIAFKHNDNKPTQLKTFKPCSEYDLDRIVVNDYLRSLKKKNKKRQVKKSG